jgi:hypothetical protein
MLALAVKQTEDLFTQNSHLKIAISFILFSICQKQNTLNSKEFEFVFSSIGCGEQTNSMINF